MTVNQDPDLGLPELPNIFSLLAKIFHDSSFFLTLHLWESFIFSIGVGAAIILLFYGVSKNLALLPSGVQNGLEWFVEIFDQFIEEILGEEGRKFVPFLGTVFLYILAMNLLVLIPLLKPPTSSLNTTIGFAIVIFILVQYLNIKNQGFFGFVYHLAGSPKSGIEWALVPLMFPIELLTQVTRPMTLALRLFGNVFGEDILIGIFSLFGVSLFSDLVMPLIVPLQIPFMFLAILTGIMQAFVFTLLSTVYILLSYPSKEGH